MRNRKIRQLRSSRENRTTRRAPIKHETKMPPHGGTNMMISLFAWNTRGFHKKRKHLYLRSWLQSAKPSFGCLIETRFKKVIQRQLSLLLFQAGSFSTIMTIIDLEKSGSAGQEMLMLQPFTKVLQSSPFGWLQTQESSSSALVCMFRIIRLSVSVSSRI